MRYEISIEEFNVRIMSYTLVSVVFFYLGSLTDVFVISHTCIECSTLSSQGFAYKPSGCRFDFPCSHRTCLSREVPCHSSIFMVNFTLTPVCDIAKTSVTFTITHNFSYSLILSPLVSLSKW